MKPKGDCLDPLSTTNKGALLLLALLLCMGFAHQADAHSLYIQAARPHVSNGKASPLFFCYGHHLPVDDAIRSEKLKNVQVRKPDGSIVEIKLRKEKSLHSYLVEYDMPGTFALMAETTPGYFTKWKDAKGRDRHSIKPLSAVADKASAIDMSVFSRQWTKTYVTCDAPSEQFPAALGLPLELVPARDPSTWKQGDTVEFTIQRYGRPYTGPGEWDASYMGYSTQAEDMFIQKTPVKDGVVRFKLATTGRWFVRFAIKTDAPENKKSEYLTQKLTTTMVFEVPNERRKPKVDSH
ncbi:DUF4198 domain-containing protein [Salidesulfovibrio onnuriiensis]|uniref:DUF4198 domain-containing protein n=1 Tax=Salidesulfovibrio onnuriiensis TaxID=2583823 RepID=UPI00202B0C8E|nr:DUF4198 domain-containing protein [Salidesulfovibrio onnuriiensis]